MTGRTQRSAKKKERAAEETMATADAIERPSSVLDIHANVARALENRLAPVGELGAGGMATVDLVLDRALERRMVRKCIHKHLATEAGSVAMFVREAQITGQLEHPNIVPVHELGIDATNGHLFFTMKLVEGRTFSEVIRDLPPELPRGPLLDVLDVVVKVCDALAFAHSRGVIHCDVKPANVMVGDFGQVYLMDWGIARRLGDLRAPDAAKDERAEELESRSDGGSVIGTATHMAPEQARGATTLDERTDVFAVGALLYHTLTRSAPFAAETFWAAIVRAQSAAYTPLEIASPHAPESLRSIVTRAMALEPSRRYPSVLALKQDLVQFVRGGDLFPTRTFAPGEHVVREGEPGDVAYIIEAGSLEVYRMSDGVRQVLRSLGPGEVFGETAILSPGPRTASVVAVLPSTLRVVSAEALGHEVDALKPWMGTFVRTLAARFREREQAGKK